MAKANAFHLADDKRLAKIVARDPQRLLAMHRSLQETYLRVFAVAAQHAPADELAEAVFGE